MSFAYPVPSSTTLVEYEVKKSRFIGIANCASSREEAMQILEKIRVEYPDARHHCWAYLIGNPKQPSTLAMSDDGEPSGTAGKPILNVLQHKDIGDIMLVVVRYFGGIKLGAGGLVRAYSASAQAVIDEISLVDKVVLDHYEVKGDYALEQSLRHWLGQHEGEVKNVAYENQVRFTVAIKDEAFEGLQAFIQGQGAILKKLDEN